MFHLITIGDSTVDTFLLIDQATLHCNLDKTKCELCFNYADKIPITNSDQDVGGNAANVATGAAKLGVRTAIVTELGDDINGWHIKDQFEKTGVNTQLVKILPGHETCYATILVYKGERTALSYHAKRKYTLPKLPPTEWIYFTSLGETCEELHEPLLDYLSKHPSTKLALNPGSYQIRTCLEDIKALLPKTDLLLVNKEEAEKLIGKHRTMNDTFQAFSNLGVKMVVITDSEKGSYAFNGEEAYTMKTYPITPFEKTGAGDAYASGFISALIHGQSMTEAMQWGTANASGAVQHIGAQKGLRTRQGVIKIVKSYPEINPSLI